MSGGPDVSRFSRAPLVLALVLLCGPAASQTPTSVRLTDGWKFKPGDDLRYAEAAWNDSTWSPISVQRIWEDQGYEKLDSFAWYRIRFTLPSTLNSTSRIKDGVRIYLGKINNFDQTYLNGAIVGSNAERVDRVLPADTSFLRAEMTMYNVERCYVLKPDDPRLRWDSVNVLAIRVFDQGGQGGLWWGEPMIRMVTIGDYLTMDNGAAPFTFQGSRAGKTFSLHNTSVMHPLVGRLSIRAITTVDDAELASSVREIDIPPGGSERIDVSIPRSDRAAIVSYRFTYRDYPDTILAKEEIPYVVTPPAPREPRINGPVVTGARPGRPFLFSVPASGERPMRFSARGIPAGLTIGRETGIISGSVGKRGTYLVTVTAENRRGKASRSLTVEIGDRIALTPPMGWNSWNCWGLSVDAAKVLKSAQLFAARGLSAHGWSYINIDDGWEIKGDSPLPARNPDGTIVTNEKFPDMKALGDSI